MEKLPRIQKIADGLITNGNLTKRESIILNQEIEKRANKMFEEIISKDRRIYFTEEELKILRNKYKKRINKEELIKELGLGKNLESKINLGKVEHKVRYVIIHQILTFPFRFAWDILMMPYKKVVKPLANFISGVKIKKEENLTPI